MNLDKKSRALVKRAEEDQISRNVLQWLRKYPEFPSGVKTIKFEELEDDRVSIALSTIPGTYITATDITGGYEAEYQFKLVYRAQPTSDGERLEMDEILDAIGDWAVANGDKEPPDLGMGREAVKFETSTRSSLFARYENGDEDHQIIMKLTYNVNA